MSDGIKEEKSQWEKIGLRKIKEQAVQNNLRAEILMYQLYTIHKVLLKRTLSTGMNKS